MKDGASIAEQDTCGDSDDVFFDAKRKRVYVGCGAGFIDVFDAAGGACIGAIACLLTASALRDGCSSRSV